MSEVISSQRSVQTPEEGKPAPTPIPLAAIEAAVRGIRFGTVQLVIQDGRVIQIDRTEKIRLV